MTGSLSHSHALCHIVAFNVLSGVLPFISIFPTCKAHVTFLQLTWRHIWRICICCTLPYPFIKAWISVQASVNIHFLQSIWFLHSVGWVPWIRTSALSFLFLHSSLPSSCFQAQIQLDCGEDNICVPDLKLTVYGWEDVVCLCLYLVCLHAAVLEVRFYWKFHTLLVRWGVSEVFLMVLIEATHRFISLLRCSSLNCCSSCCILMTHNMIWLFCWHGKLDVYDFSPSNFPAVLQLHKAFLPNIASSC